MSAVIGVSCAWSVETWAHDPDDGGYMYVATSYVWPLVESGGIPVLVNCPPEGRLREFADHVVSLVDGLLLSGGGDAKRFKPEELPPLREQQPLRYDFERLLIEAAIRRETPVLGICRGHQMIAEVLGGDIRPELVSGHKQEVSQSEPWHPVHITPSSRLASICGDAPWDVTSFHRQAVGNPPAGFTVAAKTADGVIEAMESTKHPFLIGVQFHPELRFRQDERSRLLFQAFIEACETTARRRSH